MKTIAALAVALTIGALGCASNQNKKDTIPDEKEQKVGDADAGTDQVEPQTTGTDSDAPPTDDTRPDPEDTDESDEGAGE